MSPTKLGVHFGAMADDLSKQLKPFNLPAEQVEHWQRDADAITRLKIRSLIPDSAGESARKRLFKQIEKAVNPAPTGRPGAPGN